MIRPLKGSCHAGDFTPGMVCSFFMSGFFLKALDKTGKRVYNIIIDALGIKSIKAKKRKSAKAVLYSKGL